MRWAHALLSLALLAAAGSARADDWLAVLPACSLDETSLPALELLYPRPGLPAVVDTGGVLVTRVRVPAALTPPPGVQQERALSGWSAELIGGGLALGPDPLPHRYTLPILSIRPDAGSTLIYRVRVSVPEFVAPGSYGLQLRSPFGDREVERSVAVIAAGTSPRVAALQRAPSAAATLPVDVWLSVHDEAGENWPAADGGKDLPLQPVLAPKHRALALWVAGTLWTTPGCAVDRPSFEAEVAQELRLHAGGDRLAVDPLHLPPSAASLNAARLGDTSWTRRSSEIALDARQSGVARELRVLVPAGRGLTLTGARAELYPASDLDRRRLGAMVALVSVPVAQQGRIALRGPQPAPALRFDRASIESGVPGVVRIRGAPADARVAYEFGFARSRIAGPVLPITLEGPLEEPLRALVLSPSLGAHWVEGELRVQSRRLPSCDVAAPRGRPPAPGLLFSLVFLLKRRPRRWIGNRLRPALR